MGKSLSYAVNKDIACEIFNITNGAFYPLKGFMDSADYKSVVKNMHLDNGHPWTIPVTLDIPEDKAEDFIKADKVFLKDASGKKLAMLFIEDIYKIDRDNDIKKIFGTSDIKHPGVKKELSRSVFRVGGPIMGFSKKRPKLSKYSLSPKEARKKFSDMGWKTITGFQTRNPIHRAHEYLQRVAMEVTDGIFIQPLIGWKKADDFSTLVVIKSYERMINLFYPPSRVVLGALSTPMRYAGPREAVFHAIIRRNFGCTHFIIGRDHAGVGNYYGKYAAHALSREFNDLGIEILRLCGPFYCKKCGTIVTEKTCSHGSGYSLAVSGTYIKSVLHSGDTPGKEYMRNEISGLLCKLNKDDRLFCGKDDEDGL